MKTADFFTATRIVLAPVFFILYFLPQWLNGIINPKISICILIPLFIYMEFTDFLDGYFARKKQEVSDFGKLFDPFADVFANLTVLFCFTIEGYLFPIFFLIILYREIAMTFLRMVARGKGITIAAELSGKAKTLFYIIGCSVSLFLKLSVMFNFTSELFNVILKFNIIIYAAAAVLSVFSFLNYLSRYKATMKELTNR